MGLAIRLLGFEGLVGFVGRRSVGYRIEGIFVYYGFVRLALGFSLGLRWRVGGLRIPRPTGSK